MVFGARLGKEKELNKQLLLKNNVRGKRGSGKYLRTVRKLLLGR